MVRRCPKSQFRTFPTGACLARGALLAALLLCLGGCVGHLHRVGVGPTGLGSERGRQVYLLFGLWSLNDVDVQRMASDLTGYSIETEYGWVDLLLTPILLPLTITTRTVTVHK